MPRNGNTNRWDSALGANQLGYDEVNSLAGGAQVYQTPGTQRGYTVSRFAYYADDVYSEFPGSSGTLAAGATNYIGLSSAGALYNSTTAHQGGGTPLASATVDAGGNITGWTDDRPTMLLGGLQAAPVPTSFTPGDPGPGEYFDNTTWTATYYDTGGHMVIMGRGVLTGSPGVNELRFLIPNGKQLQLGAWFNGQRNLFGLATYTDSSAGSTYTGYFSIADGGGFEAKVLFFALQSGSPVGQPSAWGSRGAAVRHNVPFSFASGDSIQFIARIPVEPAP